MLITIAVLLCFSLAFLLHDLLLHCLGADLSCLEDDAAKDAGNTLPWKRARVLRTDTRQNLALAAAIVSRQPRRDFHGADLAGDRGPPVEQTQQLGIQQIDLLAPGLERLGVRFGFLLHSFAPFGKNAGSARPQKSKSRDWLSRGLRKFYDV